MRILVMGAGKMGSFFLDLLSFEHETAVYERDPKRMRFTYNTQRFTTMEEIEAFKPELVINAVTVKYTISAFDELLPHIPADCIISDIASVKTGLKEYYEKSGPVLQGTRRVRPRDDGKRPERRTDGERRRRIRLPRQNVHRQRRRRHTRRELRGQGSPRRIRRPGRYFPHVPGEGRPRARLGEARRDARPPFKYTRDFLARPGTRPRPRNRKESPRLPAGTRPQRA